MDLLEKTNKKGLAHLGVVNPQPPDQSLDPGGNQLSLAGTAGHLTSQLDTNIVRPSPILHAPNQVLPVLPSLPTEEAQTAIIIGPFNRTSLTSLASTIGSMTLAQMAATKEFLKLRMGMSKLEVANAGVAQADWTNNDCLRVKFMSVAHARSLNPFKKKPAKEKLCTQLCSGLLT